MQWHIDCPFHDQAFTGPTKPTLEPEFVGHMGKVHKTPDPQAIRYFTLNCHELPTQVLVG
jgi:hypothetical protein